MDLGSAAVPCAALRQYYTRPTANRNAPLCSFPCLTGLRTNCHLLLRLAALPVWPALLPPPSCVSLVIDVIALRGVGVEKFPRRTNVCWTNIRVIWPFLGKKYQHPSARRMALQECVRIFVLQTNNRSNHVRGTPQLDEWRHNRRVDEIFSVG